MIGGAALAAVGGRSGTAVFMVALGLGLCTHAPPFASRPRVHATALSSIGVAFVAFRVGTIDASSWPWPARVIVLVLEALTLAVAFVLVHDHLHGVASLVALFEDDDGGYASVLDEASAARTVEAELARSRRTGTPFAFLMLATDERSDATAARLRRTERIAQALRTRRSARVVDELERLYVQRRVCAIVARHVRRSDLVVCGQHQFLVISFDTPAAGSEALVDRIGAAVADELGVALRHGIARFPDDGSTYAELRTTAADRTDGQTPAAPDAHPRTAADAARAGDVVEIPTAQAGS